jgi:hypothetical protein
VERVVASTVLSTRIPDTVDGEYEKMDSGMNPERDSGTPPLYGFSPLEYVVLPPVFEFTVLVVVVETSVTLGGGPV